MLSQLCRLNPLRRQFQLHVTDWLPPCRLVSALHWSPPSLPLSLSLSLVLALAACTNARMRARFKVHGMFAEQWSLGTGGDWGRHPLHWPPSLGPPPLLTQWRGCKLPGSSGSPGGALGSHSHSAPRRTGSVDIGHCACGLVIPETGEREPGGEKSKERRAASARTPSLAGVDAEAPRTGTRHATLDRTET